MEGRRRFSVKQCWLLPPFHKLFVQVAPLFVLKSKASNSISRLPDSQHVPPGVRLGGAEYSFSPARYSGSHDLAEYTVSL